VRLCRHTQNKKAPAEVTGAESLAMLRRSRLNACARQAPFARCLWKSIFAAARSRCVMRDSEHHRFRVESVERVCRFHGAGGGAPEGEANGAWKRGRYSKGAKAERLLVKLFMKQAAKEDHFLKG